MAIAAVYGGPVFNILVAWAGPTLYAALRKPPVPYRLTAGVATLVLATLACLAFALAAVPLVYRWRLVRSAAVWILCIYATSQLVFLVVEELY